MVIHGVVVTLAVMATRGALEATKAADPDEPMLLFFPQPPATATESRTAPAPDVVPEPPARQFERVPIPGDVPPAIPPADFSKPAFDPRDLVWAGRDTSEVDGGVSGTGMSSAPDAIYDAVSAPVGFGPASLLRQPIPEYPPALLSVGLPGVVVVEFVIDTLGRVEPSSIHMIESSHPLLEDAARAAVLGAEFRPARLGGKPVRQITRQRIRFVPR